MSDETKIFTKNDKNGDKCASGGQESGLKLIFERGVAILVRPWRFPGQPKKFVFFSIKVGTINSGTSLDSREQFKKTGKLEIIKIAVANLHYSYQEEFLTQSIIEFLEKCFIHHSEFPILSGIGFSLSINKKDELGHYKAVINIDDDFHKIFLKFEMDLVLTEIKSFVSDLKKLAIC